MHTFYDGREMVINAFKNKIFPTVIEYPQYISEEDTGENTSSKSKSSSSSTNKLEKLLIDPLRKMLKFLKDTSDTAYNNTKVTLMKSRLRSFKNDIKNMSENEVKNKNLDL